MYLSTLEAKSAQKLAKKHIFGNLILPNFSYFGTKNGPFGPPSVAGTKIFGVMGVSSPHMAPSPNSRKFEIQNLLPSRWYLSCETLC